VCWVVCFCACALHDHFSFIINKNKSTKLMLSTGCSRFLPSFKEKMLIYIEITDLIFTHIRSAPHSWSCMMISIFDRFMWLSLKAMCEFEVPFHESLHKKSLSSLFVLSKNCFFYCILVSWISFGHFSACFHVQIKEWLHFKIIVWQITLCINPAEWSWLHYWVSSKSHLELRRVSKTGD